MTSMQGGSFFSMTSMTRFHFGENRMFNMLVKMFKKRILGIVTFFEQLERKFIATFWFDYGNLFSPPACILYIRVNYIFGQFWFLFETKFQKLGYTEALGTKNVINY